MKNKKKAQVITGRWIKEKSPDRWQKLTTCHEEVWHGTWKDKLSQTGCSQTREIYSLTAWRPEVWNDRVQSGHSFLGALGEDPSLPLAAWGGRAPGAPVSASTWPHVASSPVCPCLTESHELWYIVFLFSFISSDFLISFVLSSWIHWLVKHVLLNFHTWNFPDFLLLLMSGLPALWSEKVFCIIPTFFIFINISVA